MDGAGKKILEIAIPPVEMTSNQAKTFQDAVGYAQNHGVKLITRIVK